MEYVINNSGVYDIKGIGQLKSFQVEKISYVDDTKKDGEIIILIEYFDASYDVLKTTLNLAFHINIDDSVSDLICDNLEFTVIENQGLKYGYDLTITVIDVVDLIDEEKTVTIKEENSCENIVEEIDDINDYHYEPSYIEENKKKEKKLIEEAYDSILAKQIEKRSVETFSFMPRFNEKVSYIDVIYVKDEKNLNDVAISYHKPIEELIKKVKDNRLVIYYDKDNK